MSSDTLEYLELELRADAGKITGRIASFGEVAHGGKGPEVLRPGAIDAAVSVPLVDGHALDANGRPVIGPVIGTVEVRQEHDGYYIDATPHADDYSQDRYRELRTGLGAKLSMGFRAITDPVIDGVRELRRIALGHVALLTSTDGAYPSAAVTEVRSKGETMETNTDQPEVEAEAPAAAPDHSDEIRALSDEIAELSRQIGAVQNVRVIDSPDKPWSPEEIRTAGEWLYHSVRATEQFDWVTPTQKALSLEKLGGNEQEIRAVTSTPTSGLGAAVPKEYLGPIEELYRAGMPFVAALGSQALPADGLDIHRPVMTQGSLAAWEASEGDEPSSQAVTISDVTGSIKAIKSAAKATMQTALRTSPSAVDAILRDQAAAIGTGIGDSAINGTGTLTSSTGALAGVLANGSIVTGTAITTYNSTQLVQSIADALVSIYTTVPATRRSDIFITMAPRRWGDTLALVDGNGRPIMNVDNLPAQNTLGNAEPFFGGSILNIPIVVDDNIPENLGGGTDQDCIIVASRRSFEMFSGGRMAATWQDPATFQTTYGAAQMAALLPIYPGGLVSITGSAMT